ncbi:CoA transferase [Novosphingobium sp. G106]|uniref:CaiB/BaiF CoA transferase family protein n=1 Tax=Novosphingobium sp. G106 TaxID=2849500 RepID=UPI001C2D1855|nr:CoA transferase [Novosphingobium sp. G106]MBV1691221.1 CoA transferase [Novosphingobium sp. G106]
MKPLHGIRIADFTVHNAGPFCTHLLSQLGAEVIKVESAMRPDAFRKPHPVYGRMGPATFDQVASTKLSVRINLKKPEGVALAKRLVAVSDIAAESFRPGVIGRLGLGFEDLQAVKQDIIMLCVSSSGQSGPDKHFAGYAPLFGAWGGLGEMTGYADGPPVEMRHVMDHTVGMNSAVAVMAALQRRRATGRGGLVDVSAREVASSLLGEALLLAAAGQEPHRIGNDHLAMAPHGVYPAQGEDRWVSIAVATDEEWQALASIIDEPGLAGDPRFAKSTDRHANRAVLEPILSAWTTTLPADDIAEMLQDAGIAAHASWTTPEIAADPHLRARGAICEVQEPDGKHRAAVGVPMRLSKGAEIGIHRGTPKLGEDEDYVYGELLGLGRDERTALEEAEVIY